MDKKTSKIVPKNVKNSQKNVKNGRKTSKIGPENVKYKRKNDLDLQLNLGSLKL